MDGVETRPRTGYSLQVLLDPEPATPDANFELLIDDDHHSDMIEDGDHPEMGMHADIYIPTLSKLRMEAVGTFSLSDIKQMVASEKFLAKDDSEKGCSKTTFEDCQSERFLENVQETCKCVPWQISSVLERKVRFLLLFGSSDRIPHIAGGQLLHPGILFLPVKPGEERFWMPRLLPRLLC